MTSDMTTPPPPVLPSKWPKTLGIVCVVWGAFGFVCNFSSLGDAEIAGLYSWLSFFVGLVTSVWLLWGSVLLLRRSPASRNVLLSWSVVELITIVALTLWGFMYIDQMVELMKSNLQESVTKMDGDGTLKGMIYALTIGTAVMSSIIPLWVLLAMRNPAKRAEIEGWGSGG